MKHTGAHICVIGAEVNGIEQRQILSGIIAQAQRQQIRVTVLSNLYNSLDPEQADNADNRIYDLLRILQFDAVILLTESFVNPALRSRICSILQEMHDLPAVTIGTGLAEFDFAAIPNINTSDETDLEEITDHLIERCGFTQIALLTGPLMMQVSYTRICGYRRSLEKHGIPYDPALVSEGDFWLPSGAALAKRYLSGELPMPQALICANDYMAFGLLDAFAEVGADLTASMAVVGYEFVQERHLHTPLLTTYQRNRRALGEAAVEMIMRKLSGLPEQPFTPPHGTLICGQTCPVGTEEPDLRAELETARLDRMYADWSLKSEMDAGLTACRNLDEFCRILGQHLFMVRSAQDIWLCLYEDAFLQEEPHTRLLTCRNINPWTQTVLHHVPEQALTSKIWLHWDTAVSYLHPVFFKEQLLGYAALQYTVPDTYDNTYRHWLKSVSNALEMLHLKSDVRYLLQCRMLSPSYDSMTGMFSAAGLRDAYQLMRNAQQPARVTAAAFRFDYGETARGLADAERDTVSSLMSAARMLKRFCGGNSIIGRLSEYDFLLLFPDCVPAADLLADAIWTAISTDSEYQQTARSVQCFYYAAEFDPAQTSLAELRTAVSVQLNRQQQEHYSAAQMPHFAALMQIRQEIYAAPQQAESLQETAAVLHLNANHMNRIYKQYFGISFHQDCIRARLRQAKALLITGGKTSAETAELCGYADSKYFIRQFSADTQVSPKQYQRMMQMYIPQRAD